MSVDSVSPDSTTKVDGKAKNERKRRVVSAEFIADSDDEIAATSGGGNAVPPGGGAQQSGHGKAIATPPGSTCDLGGGIKVEDDAVLPKESDYEKEKRANIQRNQQLLEDARKAYEELMKDLEGPSGDGGGSKHQVCICNVGHIKHCTDSDIKGRKKWEGIQFGLYGILATDTDSDTER